MLKVLIADDEERVCRLVQMLGDWDALGMEVVGTAANGLEALDLVEALRPDILITDIRMPGCDGLMLIQRAKEISPQLEIIIISGYAQFEYAQTAISQGVGGYLLKPIKKEALMSTLEKLAQRCRERADSVVTMAHLLDKSHDIQWRRLIEDLLKGALIAPTKSQLAEDYDFQIQRELLQVIIVKMDCAPERLEAISVSMVQKKLEEILESMLFPLCAPGLLCFQRTAGYSILQYDAAQKDEIRRTLRDCLNQMQAQNSFFGPIEISLAVGRPTECAEKLPLSMQEAQTALAQRLVEGNRRLLEALPRPSQIRTQPLLEKYGRTISNAVDSLNAAEAGRAVDELAEGAGQTENVCGNELFELVLSAGKIFALLIKMGEDVSLTAQFEAACELCGRSAALFDCLRRFQNEQIEQLLSRKENEAIRPIRTAKQYIQQHFHEPITLEDVCAATGFSVSYFSTLFKKETGEGFSKYLTRIRIEQAKTLLQDTGLSVAEICERVGYNDLKHFTVTFKKATNLNPGQYRKLYG